MTVDDLFQLAEESHANVVIEFRSGSDEQRPNRGFYIAVDGGEAYGPALRLGEVVWAGVRAIMVKDKETTNDTEIPA